MDRGAAPARPFAGQLRSKQETARAAELARYRESIIEERNRELKRLQKVLEGANIKLGSVVVAIHNKSAQRLLERLSSGETMANSEEISKLIHKSLQPKLDEIVASLDGIHTASTGIAGADPRPHRRPGQTHPGAGPNGGNVHGGVPASHCGGLSNARYCPAQRGGHPC